MRAVEAERGSLVVLGEVGAAEAWQLADAAGHADRVSDCVVKRSSDTCETFVGCACAEKHAGVVAADVDD